MKAKRTTSPKSKKFVPEKVDVTVTNEEDNNTPLSVEENSDNSTIENPTSVLIPHDRNRDRI